MVDLPRDVQFKIISKLDIDSRRALGIYTHLKIPKHIIDTLEKCISVKNIFINSSYTRVTLGLFNGDQYMYSLEREFASDCYFPNSICYYRIDHNNNKKIYYTSLDPKISIKLPCQSYIILNYGYESKINIW